MLYQETPAKFARRLKARSEDVLAYAARHGLTSVPDRLGTNIDCQ